MRRTLDLVTSYASSVAELGAGLRVTRLGPRPERRLTLYDFEACPMCRRVREVMTGLDLEALVHPCPKGGTRFRTALPLDADRVTFPILDDPNTGQVLQDSRRIIDYLFAHYGVGSTPLWARKPLPFSVLATLARGGRGRRARPSRAPEEPLDLWSFEASPYCRLAREALCELEIPYRLHNVAKRSPSRPAFIERSGKMQVPYLVDDNTGAALFESADIVAYLERTYAA